MAVADTLHHLLFDVVPAGDYWHVYDLAYGPLATHPCCQARLALVAGRPDTVIVRPTFYIAWTPDAALWETALRDVAPDAAGGVSLLPGYAAGHGLARLSLRHPLPIVAMDHPARRKVIDYNSPEDQRWHGHLTTDRYRRTHFAAATVDAQCRASGELLPGFRWHSRQLQRDLVGVLYGALSDHWSVAETIELAAPRGQAMLTAALGRAQMVLVPDLRAVVADSRTVDP